MKKLIDRIINEFVSLGSTKITGTAAIKIINDVIVETVVPKDIDFDIVNRQSNLIAIWLKTDFNSNWVRNADNTNTFTDLKRGRALFVYEDHIKYWSDLLCHSGVREYMVPTSKVTLFNILED